MLDSLIRRIARNISITTALSAKNIAYTIHGNAVILKNNPFRPENTCSLRGYIDTNLLHDFGSGTTFNSFDILAIDCDIKSAIKTSMALHHGLLSVVKPIPQHKNVACNKTNFTEEFARFEKINLNKARHLQEMIKILPLHKWLNPELNSFFSKYCRFDSQNDTLVVGIFEKEILVGYKWRRLNINGIVKKWIARRRSIASTPMLNIISGDNCIFVCEGMHDFLSATMASKSVLSIPSANYTQDLPDYICLQLADMTIYLVPDNDAVGLKLMERMRQQLNQVSPLIIDFTLPPIVHDFSEFLALE
jgi:hypothetical protein